MAAAYGYELLMHRHELYGVCASCRASNATVLRTGLHNRIKDHVAFTYFGAWTVLETADAEAARVAYFVASTAARRGTMTELVDDQGETVDARISDRARSFKAARIGPRQRALF